MEENALKRGSDDWLSDEFKKRLLAVDQCHDNPRSQAWWRQKNSREELET